MLIGSYSSSLVLISLCVAILASYTALDLTGRIATAKGRAVHLWMLGGAFAMGIGIWSMHFIGMLAFSLPISLGYDTTLTALSLLIAVASSGFALWLVSQPKLPLMQLGFGALIMGSGIACMHYTGMAALRMQPGIDYDPTLFGASLAIAVGASAAALWIAFRLRQHTPYVRQFRGWRRWSWASPSSACTTPAWLRRTSPPAVTAVRWSTAWPAMAWTTWC